MGIRQAVNEHPGVSTGVATGVILLMLGVIVWEAISTPHPGAGRPVNAFYSDDDGQTWFTAPANKLTPFTDEHGKQAVYAFVFKCGGRPFVGYLMRATDEARQAATRSGRSADDVPFNPMYSEVKKPGGATWVKFDLKDNRPFKAIAIPTCPDGGRPVPVMP